MPKEVPNSLSPKHFRYRITGVYIGLLIFSVVFVYRANPQLVRFSSFTVVELIQALAPLVLVAAFIERALEIFVTATRAGARELLRLEVERLADGSVEKKNKENELATYKNRTNRLAFLYGATLGIIAASLGVRALELFLDANVVAGLESWQSNLLKAFDVVLSGALLGGGADGLHKITASVTRHLEQNKP